MVYLCTDVRRSWKTFTDAKGHVEANEILVEARQQEIWILYRNKFILMVCNTNGPTVMNWVIPYHMWSLICAHKRWVYEKRKRFFKTCVRGYKNLLDRDGKEKSYIAKASSFTECLKTVLTIKDIRTL